MGPIFDPELHAWRIRHNAELQQLCDIPPITSVIRSMRLRWAGHLARMEDDSPTKRLFLGQPEGRRPPGRPRKRWRDVVTTDLSTTGLRNVRRWTEVAQDRRRWRQLVIAARDHRGPEPAEYSIGGFRYQIFCPYTHDITNRLFRYLRTQNQHFNEIDSIKNWDIIKMCVFS